MLELTWTCFKSSGRLSNFIKIPSRNKATVAAMMIRMMNKEQKEIFGPLLENSKAKKRRMSKAKQEGKPKVNDKNSKKLSDGKENGEFAWTMNSTNSENVKFMKKVVNTDEKAVNKNPTYQFLRLQNQDDCSIMSASEKRKEKSTVKISRNSKEDSGEEFHDSNLRKGAEGENGNHDSFHGTETIDELQEPVDSLNLRPKITTLKLKEIDKFPIFSDKKDDNDHWEGKDIVTLSPTQQSDFSLPGVTRVLNDTMSNQSKLMLEKWKARMIQMLGEEGFNSYCEAQLNDSKLMHMLIEKTLKNESVQVPQHLKLSLASANFILKDIDNVRMIESHVVHPTLGYRGFVDCVAEYRGNLCLIDWKKSEKIKTLSSTYDSPLQISAYIGALNADPNYPFQVKTGLLAIAYSHGQPPSIFEFSAARLEFYWREWLKRLEKYHSMRLT